MRTKPLQACGMALTLLLSLPVGLGADEPANPDSKTPRRLLLLGQGSDGHPPQTHEYVAGLELLTKLLDRVEGLETRVVDAGEPWRDGPDRIDAADGVVLFLAEGARWIHQDPARLAALKRLAARGGAITGLHWGIGTREAQFIDEYVALVGGCHGGPDRKYAVVEVLTEIVAPEHPIMTGCRPITIQDEFYYRLKFTKLPMAVTPLLRVPIEGESHTVAWAWDRPDKGRSFGFSGLHFHKNWQHEDYRRAVAQGIVWTLKLPIPEQGLNVEIE